MPGFLNARNHLDRPRTGTHSRLIHSTSVARCRPLIYEVAERLTMNESASGATMRMCASGDLKNCNRNAMSSSTRCSNCFIIFIPRSTFDSLLNRLQSIIWYFRKNRYRSDKFLFKQCKPRKSHKIPRNKRNLNVTRVIACTLHRWLHTCKRIHFA